MAVTAFVAFGSNLGGREQNIERAIGYLRRIEGIEVVRVSSSVESEPVGCPPGSGKFLNGVIKLSTTLGARELLGALLAVEAKLGRERAMPNAPRTIDLDLLLYGDAVISEPGLCVPHPRMHERLFVLWPLLQIEPRAKDPRTGEPFADAYARLRGMP
jgi:2-amino-4-hydroxy-6-hydroxymethyldihydropteridine diphosphokinase